MNSEASHSWQKANITLLCSGEWIRKSDMSSWKSIQEVLIIPG